MGNLRCALNLVRNNVVGKISDIGGWLYWRWLPHMLHLFLLPFYAVFRMISWLTRMAGKFYWIWLPNIVFALVLLVYPVFAAISWLRIGGKKLLGIKPSVVWGPTPIINIIESSNILRRLGYKSDTIVYTTYYITRNFDMVLEKYLQKQEHAVFLPHLVFLWTLLKYDIYHFFYDFGFWAGMNVFRRAKWIELPLLRLAGKRVIVSAYGADVRYRSHDEMWPVNLCQECPEPGRHCICDSERAQVNAKYNSDWANVCLAMGDMHDYVFGSRVDFNYWPIDTQSVSCAGTGDHERPLKIVHSPNHRHFKGTRYIQEAVERLKEKGYDLELALVERVSNAEARRMYAEADIVAAQCIAGWIGFTEIEAMAAGKPVIGYIRDMNRYLGHAPGCPIVNADRTMLTAKMEEVVASPTLRKELGRKGRAYVEKEWSSEAVAPVYEELHADVWRHNRLLQTLLDRVRDFRYGEYGYRLGRDAKSDGLGEWPVWRNGFLGIAKVAHGMYSQPPFSDQGIVLTFSHGRPIEDPGRIAFTALDAFHCMLQEPANRKYENLFTRHANWLSDNLDVQDGDLGHWRLKPAESCPAPVNGKSHWSAHGVGLSVLLRVFQHSRDPRHMVRARQAAAFIAKSAGNGRRGWRDHDPGFQGGPSESEGIASIRGFLDAFFGLYEYGRVTKENWVKDLLDDAINTLVKTLPKYDLAWLDWLHQEKMNYYDGGYYVIQQLLAVRKLTGKVAFGFYAGRWRSRLYRVRLLNFGSGNMPL